MARSSRSRRSAEYGFMRIAYSCATYPQPALARLAAPLVAEALTRQAAADGAKVRLRDETTYQADSWTTPRRVIIKAEALVQGTNTRFVVTTRPEAPSDLYAWYTHRGQTENWIKDRKAAGFADRRSCPRFLANQVRLLVHGAAYGLLAPLQRWLVQAGSERMGLEPVRLRLLTIGGRIWQWSDHVRLRLASSHPGEPLWHRLATRDGRS